MKDLLNNGSQYSDVDNPFFDEENLDQNYPIVVDMTEHADIKGRALRVELRKTKNPAVYNGKVPPHKKIAAPQFIIGLISEADLPEEGKPFEMAYHNGNDMIDFGRVNTYEPIKDLEVDGDCYYFTLSEGQWRLKILDAGN